MYALNKGCALNNEVRLTARVYGNSCTLTEWLYSSWRQFPAEIFRKTKEVINRSYQSACFGPLSVRRDLSYRVICVNAARTGPASHPAHPNLEWPNGGQREISLRVIPRRLALDTWISNRKLWISFSLLVLIMLFVVGLRLWKFPVSCFSSLEYLDPSAGKETLWTTLQRFVNLVAILMRL